MSVCRRIKGSGVHGQGVVAQVRILKGTVILHFGGDVFTFSTLPAVAEGDVEHYLQIGPDLFLGPSGDIDDFVNHSCEPNTEVEIDGYLAWLRALRDIEVGEEILFDYSSTIDGDPWQMTCSCGTASCRGIIKEYASH